MLTLEEQRMLSWLTSQYPLPSKHIIDLGCFLGGSNTALPYGLQLTKQLEHHIDSYDRFEVDQKVLHKHYYPKRPGTYFPDGDSIPIFKKLTHVLSHFVTAHKGDILEESWNEGNIGLLFIDICKTAAVNNHVLETFFPHLVKGSVIVQQDYLFLDCPWLIYSMEQLKPKISFASYTEDYSVLFHVNEPVTSKDIQKALYSKPTEREVLASFDTALEYFPYFRQKEMLLQARDAFTKNPAAEVAWQVGV